MRSEVEEQILEFFVSGGQIAIYDANVRVLPSVLSDRQNATKKERYELRDRFEPLGAQLFFIGAQGAPLNADRLQRAYARTPRSSRPTCERSSCRVPTTRAGTLPGRWKTIWHAFEPTRMRTRPSNSRPSHARSWPGIRELTRADVKIINGGDRIVINNVFGYLQSRIVFFLMVRCGAASRRRGRPYRSRRPQNIHHRYRTIWFARVRLLTPRHR